MSSYYKDKDFKYPERAILMEDVSINNPIGKFIIPILTPTCNFTKLITKTHPKYDIHNIINDVIVNNLPYIEQNFIELNIPKYMFSSNNFSKGTEFIVQFINGSIDNAKITGVY